ncbi:MAG: hypothetical protein RI898_1468 [Actinomycetota bacterium]
MAMVVSTGVGGGIVLNGQLLEGASGNAGHIGHVIVEPNGRRCACGGRGCLEAEASGPAIEAITRNQRTRSWCALDGLLVVALRQSAIFLTFNSSALAEALRLGSVQRSLIQPNAHLTNYADLNFLAVPELFRLAWPTKVDSLVRLQLVGVASTAWHLRRTNWLSL